MTQEELQLVLNALKWCHGGEPCGTAEAIAVIEKALANVATNDTSKEYVDEMQKQRHETVEDNSQQWKGMDGAIAFHLIERHADNLDDIRKMMGEWLSANTPQRTEQEPVVWQTMEAKYPTLEKLDIRMGDGSILCNLWPQIDGDLWWEGSGTGEKFIDPKYANVTHWRVHSDTAPPQRTWVEMTDEEIDVIDEATWDEDHKSWDIHGFARGIEAKLKEKNT